MILIKKIFILILFVSFYYIHYTLLERVIAKHNIASSFLSIYFNGFIVVIILSMLVLNKILLSRSVKKVILFGYSFGVCVSTFLLISLDCYFSASNNFNLIAQLQTWFILSNIGLFSWAYSISILFIVRYVMQRSNS